MQMLIPSRRCHQQHGYRGCWRPSAFPVEMAWKKPLGSDDAAIGVRMPDELYLSSKCSVTFVGKRHPLKCSSKPTFLHKTLQFDRNLQNLNFNRMSWGRYFEESSNSGPDRLTWQQFSPLICWIFWWWNPHQKGAAGSCDGRTVVKFFQGLVCDCAARGDIDGFKLSFKTSIARL